MLRKFDVCLSPSDEPLTQWTIESDASGEFEALRNVRAVYGGTVKINSVTPHEDRVAASQKPAVTIIVRIKNYVNDYLNSLFTLGK